MASMTVFISTPFLPVLKPSSMALRSLMRSSAKSSNSSSSTSSAGALAYIEIEVERPELAKAEVFSFSALASRALCWSFFPKPTANILPSVTWCRAKVCALLRSVARDRLAHFKSKIQKKKVGCIFVRPERKAPETFPRHPPHFRPRCRRSRSCPGSPAARPSRGRARTVPPAVPPWLSSGRRPRRSRFA